MMKVVFIKVFTKIYQRNSNLIEDACEGRIRGFCLRLRILASPLVWCFTTNWRNIKK